MRHRTHSSNESPIGESLLQCESMHRHGAIRNRDARARRGVPRMDAWKSSQPQFLSALAAIIVIDLVLAGDNAIVIALAARNLPRATAQRAIIWGTVGAVVVRIAMTLVVVWLLGSRASCCSAAPAHLDRLQAAAARQGRRARPRGQAADGFWGAMQTIVSPTPSWAWTTCSRWRAPPTAPSLLVVLGLLISIPIVDLGLDADPQVGRALSRGSSTSASACWRGPRRKMIVIEPLFKDYFAAHRPRRFAPVCRGVRRRVRRRPRRRSRPPPPPHTGTA